MLDSRFVFISKSIFHFSLSCLGKNYGLSLRVAKKLLSMIVKSSMISAQYLPMRAIFIDLMMSFVDIVNLLFYLSVVMC